MLCGDFVVRLFVWSMMCGFVCLFAWLCVWLAVCLLVLLVGLYVLNECACVLSVVLARLYDCFACLLDCLID